LLSGDVQKGEGPDRPRPKIDFALNPAGALGSLPLHAASRRQGREPRPTNTMRLTREKIVRISHQLIDLLVQSNEVEFIEDRDTIRQHIVQTITNVLHEEEKVEVEVRKRISSQKKEILEGSEEWDLLFRKYYSEELRRMGISAAPEEHQRAATANFGVRRL